MDDLVDITGSAQRHGRDSILADVLDKKGHEDKSPQVSVPHRYHDLRTRMEHPETPSHKKRKVNGKSDLDGRRKSVPSPHQPTQDLAFSPVVSDRRAVRARIENVTKSKRERFFIEKQDYFLPLLPKSNHISKLVGKMKAQTSEAVSPISNSATIAYKHIAVQPRGITAVMKPYQLSGLSFLVYLYNNGLSGILGDEMGLGKTLQTLSLVQYLKENRPVERKENRPFLIICSLSVLSSWMAETKKWTPTLRTLRFHGPAKERDRLKKIAAGELDQHGHQTKKYKNKINMRRQASGKAAVTLEPEDEECGIDVVVTTYEAYLAEDNWFKRAFVWRYVVLDEGHKIKNDLSLISKALQGLQAEYRLILTGTPLQNNLSELWALLLWLYPEIFTDKTNDLFRTSFDLTRGLYSDTVLDASRKLLELVMLRRMKNSPSVDLNLPPKTEVLLFVPLSPMQRFWYTRLITRMDEGLLEDLFKGVKEKEMESVKQEAGDMADIDRDIARLSSTAGNDADNLAETRAILQQTIARERDEEGQKHTTAWKKLMNLLMQLRKVCNHPYQMPTAAPEPFYPGEHIVSASGKFVVLDKLIQELVVVQKRKILIFSGFTRMLDLVEDLLNLRGGDGHAFNYSRLDGGTARARRNLGIRLFNEMGSEHRVMLISTRAGGLGINLASASDVVLLDQDWNPQITLQAESRAHRIGQKNPVTVYKLVSQGTVEEQMMGRIQKKLYLSAKVTEAMNDIHTPSKVASVGDKSKASFQKAEDEMPKMSTSQLMTLVRRGTSAISRPEIDIQDMQRWDWATTVAKCKNQAADVAIKKDITSDLNTDEDQERQWLSELERVEACVFEGKKLARGRKYTSNADLVEEWNRANRRVGKNTTVMVGGYAVNKESMSCGEWEAVPTFAGRDPRLAQPKREKPADIEPQDHCQVCFDGGSLVLCARCPRSYHVACLDEEHQIKAEGPMGFICPQHQCTACEQKTTEAGGMLYRCRWCERAFCEDDLDFDLAVLIGDTLKEYDLLGYGATDQAHYVSCHICVTGLKDPDREQDRIMIADMIKNIDADWTVMQREMAQNNVEQEADLFTSSAKSEGEGMSVCMTDATTITTSGVSTPILNVSVAVSRCGHSPKPELHQKAIKTPKKHIKMSKIPGPETPRTKRRRQDMEPNSLSAVVGTNSTKRVKS